MSFDLLFCRRVHHADDCVASNTIYACLDLIVCRHTDVLTNIYDALEDNGFLMFFEMTTVLPTLLWGLDAQCWNFEDEREFGLWVPRERWEKLLREVGFTEVRSCCRRHWQSGRSLRATLAPASPPCQHPSTTHSWVPYITYNHAGT